MNMTEKTEQLIIIFFIFAFAGWIIELVFRSIYERQFVNPGFHKGPWLPLYGLAGVIIYLVSGMFAGYSILVRMFFYFILCTVLEFLAGIFLLKAFNKQYWDYSINRFNIMGLICPLYSCGWVIISIIVELFILQRVANLAAFIPTDILPKADAVLLSIFLIDFLVSSGLIDKKYYYKIRGRIGR